MLDALVAISVSFDAMLVVFVEMLDALVEILDALVAISESLELMFVVFELILASTSDILPNVRVPSMSASLRTVTVPEVWPKDKSPVEKSPVTRFTGVIVSISPLLS